MPQSGFMIGDPDEGYLKEYETKGFPEIETALENKKVRFLIGTRLDGIRMVAIILLLHRKPSLLKSLLDKIKKLLSLRYS